MAPPTHTTPLTVWSGSCRSLEHSPESQLQAQRRLQQYRNASVLFCPDRMALFHCDNIRHQGLHSHGAPRHTFMTWVSGTDICSHQLNTPSSHTYTDTQDALSLHLTDDTVHTYTHTHSQKNVCQHAQFTCAHNPTLFILPPIIFIFRRRKTATSSQLSV